MKRTSVFLLPLAIGAFLLAFPRPASALGPLDIEVGARIGGGSNPIKEDPINPLGFGAGGRAGVSILGLYGGVSGMYYFGGSMTQPVLPPAASVKVTQTSWLYGVDVGYGLKIFLLTLRPTVGVGSYTIHTAVQGGVSTDVHNVYVEPGATAMLGFGLWFVGADANALLTPGLSSSKAALIANGQVGVKF